MNIGSGMLLDRTIQPKVRDIEHLAVQMPQRCTMPNGVSLNVLDSGDNEVVRIDLLMGRRALATVATVTGFVYEPYAARRDASVQCGEIAEKLDYYGAWLELSSASEYAYVTLYSLNKYLPQTLEILESIVKSLCFRRRSWVL